MLFIEFTKNSSMEQLDADRLENAWSSKDLISAPNRMGAWQFEVCSICLELRWLYRRSCCGFLCCESCLKAYYTAKVECGLVTIECINLSCHNFVHRDEIAVYLNIEAKEIYYRLLSPTNSSRLTKTCPRCNFYLIVSENEYKMMLASRNGLSLSK